ncbi:hypothetical protein A3715_34700 [Oleiphilus sp. HI0009]|nr:hypothetical protein A3715_11375 [Oleiphilus sp. HI0009]KZX81889.1 hypothetical protein A3715_34700 [Oleiphilus sp. HI0009]
MINTNEDAIPEEDNASLSKGGLAFAWVAILYIGYLTFFCDANSSGHLALLVLLLQEKMMMLATIAAFALMVMLTLAQGEEGSKRIVMIFPSSFFAMIPYWVVTPLADSALASITVFLFTSIPSCFAIYYLLGNIISKRSLPKEISEKIWLKKE